MEAPSYGTQPSYRRVSHLERYGKTYIVLIAFVGCAVVAAFSSWTRDTYFGETHRAPGPRHEVIGKAEVVWEAPMQGARAVLFVAHGCSHGAVDFWRASRGCRQCTGLPEEMSITRQALVQGYAVVAVSSADRKGSRCWQLGSGSGKDLHLVKHALTTVLRREGLDQLPLFALGASSGGAFVLALAAHLPLLAVCSQIMALPPATLSDLISQREANGLGGSYPPVLFVHMTRDRRTAELVQQDQEVLTQQGIATRVLPVAPAPLTPTYLAQSAAPEITLSQSKAIHSALKAEGFLDSDGMLLDDPRESSWRDVLRRSQVPNIESMRLEPDLSAVAEELNVLYAQHEIVASTTSETLKWFDSLVPS